MEQSTILNEDKLQEDSVAWLFRITTYNEKSFLNCSEFPNGSIITKGQIGS